MDSQRAAYDELYLYTLEHQSPDFILQHVVDAFGAQTATAATKPIALTFTVLGLYLRVERQFTGRQVQLAHVRLGKRKRQWPHVRLPQDRGAMTAADVLAAPAGPARDRAIDAWCRSVWDAYRESTPAIVELLRQQGIV